MHAYLNVRVTYAKYGIWMVPLLKRWCICSSAAGFRRHARKYIFASETCNFGVTAVNFETKNLDAKKKVYYLNCYLHK